MRWLRRSFLILGMGFANRMPEAEAGKRSFPESSILRGEMFENEEVLNSSLFFTTNEWLEFLVLCG